MKRKEQKFGKTKTKKVKIYIRAIILQQFYELKFHCVIAILRKKNNGVMK